MSTRYTVETVRESPWPTSQLVLRDNQARSTARILPDLGCNLVGFSVTNGGRSLETFLQPSDEATPRDPGSYGAPVLFPYPNRIRDGRFRFEGQEFHLDVPPKHPHSIHGLVRDLPWRVVEAAATDDGAVARCEIDSANESIQRQFPFGFRCELTFRLSGSRIAVQATATNVGDRPMPMGFGWHPYFRLPLARGGDRRGCLVTVPADSLWELDPTLVPTGRIVALPPVRDFRRAKELQDTLLDDVYTHVQRAGESSACHLLDPTIDVKLTIRAGATFREWVVYAPPTRPTICFEPYTCPTDAFNLANRDLDVGLIVLKPGESWSDAIVIEVR